MIKTICVFFLITALIQAQNSINQLTSLNFRSKDVIPLPRIPKSVPMTLNGEYTTSISNDPDLRIRFDGNQVSIINGCNHWSGQYQARTFGQIKFEPLVGTKRACLVDFDSLYTTALTKSVSFENYGNRIVFKDAAYAITITLYEYKSRQDNCEVISCAFGSVCRNGKCVQDQSVNLCASIRCPSNQLCQNGRCVAYNCGFVGCDRGQTCQNGQCVPILGYCGAAICQQGYVCSNNRCVPCHREQPFECGLDFDCKAGEICQNRRCVANRCLTVKCYPGARCDNGKCVPDIQGYPGYSEPWISPTPYPSTQTPYKDQFGMPKIIYSTFNQVQP